MNLLSVSDNTQSPATTAPDSTPADPIPDAKPVTEAPSLPRLPTIPGGAPALLLGDSPLIPRNGLFSPFQDSQFQIVVTSRQYLLVSTIVSLQRAQSPRYAIVVHSQC